METQEATRLEYSPLYGLDETTDTITEGATGDTMVNDAVTWVVLVVCLVGWTVIGFFLWIPRVIRAVLLFSVALVQSTVTESGTQTAGRHLRSAASFYMRGFVGAVDSIRSREQSDGADSEPWSIESGLILRETAWALVVWYLILWAVGFPQITPVDMVVWLYEAPWAEMWATIASIPELFRS